MAARRPTAALRTFAQAKLMAWCASAGMLAAAPGAAQAQPTAPALVTAEEPAPLLREGMFVIEREGRVLRHDTGAWIFLPDAQEGKTHPPPMILQPSLNLMALQRLAEGRGGASRFRLSGEVFTHRGRNHLLVTRYETVAPQSAGEAPADEAPEPTELPRPAEPSSDPTVAELIRALESATPQRDAGAAAPMRAQPRAPASVDSVNLLREGALLFSRTGRVVRESGGAYVFVVDADVDSAPEAEPPLRLAPSLATMALEAAVEAVGGALPVVISGRALLYEGRNYLLPTVFRIRQPARGELTTAQ